MKLSCPHCDTSLEVHVDPTPSGARPVECAACGRTFHWSHKDSTIAAEALVITSEEIPYEEESVQRPSSAHRGSEDHQKDSTGIPLSTALLSSLLCGIVGWWLGAMGVAVPPGPAPYGNAPPIVSETDNAPLDTLKFAAAEKKEKNHKERTAKKTGSTPPLPNEADSSKTEGEPSQKEDDLRNKTGQKPESKKAVPTTSIEPPPQAPILEEKSPNAASQKQPEPGTATIPAPQAANTTEEKDEAIALKEPPKSSEKTKAKKKSNNDSKSSKSSDSGSYDSQMREARKLMKSGSTGAIRQALALYKTAEQKTSSVEPIAKQGDAHLKLSEYGKAIDNYQRAIQKNPSYRAAHIGLARAYKRSGNRDKARTAYQGYLERFPDGNQAPEARSALNNL